MRQDYSTGENEFKSPIFDKVNWHWILPSTVIIFLTILIILAMKSVDAIAFIGFAVFFILGFLVGQSKWWYAVRRIWREVVHQDIED